MGDQDAPSPSLDDSEIVYRRVPPKYLVSGISGPEIRSSNFQPREHLREKDLSVNRACLTTPHALLDLVAPAAFERLGPKTHWRVAAARASDIRKLGLEVVADPQPGDPGHALIRSASTSLSDQYCQKKLAELFQIVEMDLPTSPDDPAE